VYDANRAISTFSPVSRASAARTSSTFSF